MNTLKHAELMALRSPLERKMALALDFELSARLLSLVPKEDYEERRAPKAELLRFARTIFGAFPDEEGERKEAMDLLMALSGIKASDLPKKAPTLPEEDFREGLEYCFFVVDRLDVSTRFLAAFFGDLFSYLPLKLLQLKYSGLFIYDYEATGGLSFLSEEEKNALREGVQKGKVPSFGEAFREDATPAVEKKHRELPVAVTSFYNGKAWASSYVINFHEAAETPALELEGALEIYDDDGQLILSKSLCLHSYDPSGEPFLAGNVETSCGPASAVFRLYKEIPVKTPFPVSPFVVTSAAAEQQGKLPPVLNLAGHHAGERDLYRPTLYLACLDDNGYPVYGFSHEFDYLRQRVGVELRLPIDGVVPGFSKIIAWLDYEGLAS